MQLRNEKLQHQRNLIIVLHPIFGLDTITLLSATTIENIDCMYYL